MATQEELLRLNTAMLFLETIIDTAPDSPTSVIELAWAAHSYIQSVTLPEYPPGAEAEALFCKLQIEAAIAEVKRRAV